MVNCSVEQVSTPSFKITLRGLNPLTTSTATTGKSISVVLDTDEIRHLMDEFDAILEDHGGRY